jgi:hypothetical protein
MVSNDPSFSIRDDSIAGILHIRLSGFWTRDTYASYVSNLAPYVARYNSLNKSYRALCDLSEFGVQAASMNEKFTQQLAGRGQVDPFLALVVPSALSRLQVQRWLSNEKQKIFVSREEALLWIKSV